LTAELLNFTSTPMYHLFFFVFLSTISSFSQLTYQNISCAVNKKRSANSYL
jgi:hypothetical protein